MSVEMQFPRIIVYAIGVVVTTNSLVVLISFGALLRGLFEPVVDNKEIFAIIGPALIATVSSFATILGSLAGFIAGRSKTES